MVALQLLSLVPKAHAKPGEGTPVVVPTSLGDLHLREYGDRGEMVAFALHGAVDEEWANHEWDDAAAELAEHANYNVFLPNLHTLRAHAEKLRPQGLLTALQEVMRWATNASEPSSEEEAAVVVEPIPLLMGKSWGGSLAGEIAALPSKPVRRLVLVAPVLSSRGRSILCETALFCAEDDHVFKQVKAMRNNRLKNLITYYTEDTGGHRILKSYTHLIVGFGRRAENDHPRNWAWFFAVLPLLAAPPLYVAFMCEAKPKEPEREVSVADPEKPPQPPPKVVGAAE